MVDSCLAAGSMVMASCTKPVHNCGAKAARVRFPASRGSRLRPRVAVHWVDACFFLATRQPGGSRATALMGGDVSLTLSAETPLHTAAWTERLLSPVDFCARFVGRCDRRWMRRPADVFGLLHLVAPRKHRVPGRTQHGLLVFTEGFAEVVGAHSAV